MAAHYDAGRHQEFLYHSAIVVGDLVLAPVALLPTRWVRGPQRDLSTS